MSDLTLTIFIALLAAVTLALAMRVSYWLINRGWTKHCVCPRCDYHDTTFEADACPNCMADAPCGGLLLPQRWARFRFLKGWEIEG